MIIAGNLASSKSAACSARCSGNLADAERADAVIPNTVATPRTSTE